MISVKVKSEKGSAFILALMVVAAVGLLVVPVIYLATTGLRSTNLAQQRFLERYAAAAGVENGIWIIEDSPPTAPGPPGKYYTGIFNNLPTDINITLLALPPDMVPPPTTVPVDGPGMAIDKIVIPHVVPPCMLGEFGCPSDVRFTYTIFIENYGDSKLHLERLGDCLPIRFKYDNEFQVTRVEGIFDNASNDPLTLDDMNDDPEDDYLQKGPAINDDDADFSCMDGREQVKWEFGNPQPYIASETRAEIEFEATAQILETRLKSPAVTR